MKINVNNANISLTVGNPKQFPLDPRPEIALSGRSNVGKSSLINTLLGRKSLARVSSAPGKTITINYYDIDKKLYLVDLPGYGYAKRALEDKKRWSALTDGYFSKNPNIDLLRLVVQLIDVRVGPTEDDIMMLRYLCEAGIPFFIVATKCDKLSKSAVEKTLEDWRRNYFDGEAPPMIAHSATSGLGKEQVLKEIYRALPKKG